MLTHFDLESRRGSGRDRGRGSISSLHGPTDGTEDELRAARAARGGRSAASGGGPRRSARVARRRPMERARPLTADGRFRSATTPVSCWTSVVAACPGPCLPLGDLSTAPQSAAVGERSPQTAVCRRRRSPITEAPIRIPGCIAHFEVSGDHPRGSGQRLRASAGRDAAAGRLAGDGRGADGSGRTRRRGGRREGGAGSGGTGAAEVTTCPRALDGSNTCVLHWRYRRAVPRVNGSLREHHGSTAATPA